MLDLVETRERENKWWASGIILCVCVCVCVCTLSCVRMSACTCIWFVSRNTSSGTLRCKSAQEGKCVYSGTDACSPRCFQAPWMTPPPLSWEELLGGAKQLQTYKPKGPEIRQDVTSSWTLAIQRFTLFVSLLLPLSFGRKKKNPSSKPAFTTSVNPSQLQSLMIRSLINATGKERS